MMSISPLDQPPNHCDSLDNCRGMHYWKYCLEFFTPLSEQMMYQILLKGTKDLYSISLNVFFILLFSKSCSFGLSLDEEYPAHQLVDQPCAAAATRNLRYQLSTWETW